MHILILDDDADDLFLFCKALREVLPEANCVEARNFVELVEVAKNMPSPEVIFIDMHMSPMSGAECLLEIRKTFDVLNSKIVVYSGVVNPNEAETFRALGVDAMLAKGTDYKEMKANIGNLLKGRYHLDHHAQ